MKETNIPKTMHFCGLANQTAEFFQNEHLCNPILWKKLVDIFRSQTDGQNGGWRGEFWGKMMRGAVLVYQYTQNTALYEILTDSVRDLLTVAETDGRVSSYTRQTELDFWDIWGRKYVILGCEYYLEICRDEKLKQEIVIFISRCADYILEHIGPNKKEIVRASRNWLGLNSASILEPMVRLYRLTGQQRYLDFATYIIESGGADGINIFALAYENRLYPYQYGVTKAYEMTSCFEGLLEYYEVTGIEKYKTAVINYAKAVIDSEISIIGSCGMTHEVFSHTRTWQTVRDESYVGMQETCVTVTMMKFFARLLPITKDSIFADVIEKAFYNAYLGALNTEHSESQYPYQAYPNVRVVSTDLPTDSYGVLTPDRRGKIIGGFQFLPDFTYYGCCASISAAGVGVFLKNAVMIDDDEVTVNFYEQGKVEFTYRDVPVTMEITTDYPADGRIEIHIFTQQPVTFVLKLRNPGWTDAPKGYMIYNQVWMDNLIELNWDMPIKIHFPEHVEEDTVYTDMSQMVRGYHTVSPVEMHHKKEEENYLAVTRGPLTLAADSRTGKPASSAFSVPHNGTLCENKITDGVPCFLKMRFEGEEGEEFFLVDYAHAGRDWKTEIAAWLPTK